MNIVRVLKIEEIKEFLKTKGLIWDGIIRDPWKMMFRPADRTDFDREKIVRLVVTKPNDEKKFIQRVIVSLVKFRIENLNLKKMDSFESFNEEWIEFLNLKTKTDLKTKHDNLLNNFKEV